ncbi:hypothetical protein NEIG_01326 [Nematocida sp. ERTm5]|nr:hypothetical protein NEIG_01326 [Nematocida sp. ERTm5]
MNKRKYGDGGPLVNEKEAVKADRSERIYEIMTKNARMLREQELQLITNKIPYGEYFCQYYEVWLKDKISNGLLECVWYTEKDLWMLSSYMDSFMEFRDFISHYQMSIRLETQNKGQLLQTELFDKIKGETVDSSPIIIIKGIGERVSIKTLIAEIEKRAEVGEWAISQSGGAPEGFQKSIYIQTEMDLAGFKQAVQSALPEEAVITVQYLPTTTMGRAVKEVGCQFMDKYAILETERQAKNILQKMSELFGVPDVYKTVSAMESKVKPEEIGDLYILALRKVFNFCYYCGIKYDNPYEMVFKCGLFHLRNNSVLDESSPEDFQKQISYFEIDRMNYLTNIPKTIDVHTFCTDTKEKGEIECRFCEKKFESIEFFEKHLERKKHKAYEMSIKLHNDFLQCINVLNYQLINEIEKRHLKIPFEVYEYMCANSNAATEEIDYTQLDKKYPVLYTNKPISIEEFGEHEL